METTLHSSTMVRATRKPQLSLSGAPLQPFKAPGSRAKPGRCVGLAPSTRVGCSTAVLICVWFGARYCGCRLVEGVARATLRHSWWIKIADAEIRQMRTACVSAHALRRGWHRGLAGGAGSDAAVHWRPPGGLFFVSLCQIAWRQFVVSAALLDENI